MTTDDYNIQIDKGISLVKDGNYGKAIKYFEKAHAIKPNGLDAIRHKAASLANIDNHDEAIKWFDKALDINPENSDLLRRKGVSLARKGKYSEAIECYNKALDIKPNDPKALRYKGNSLAAKGDQNEAIKCYDKALALVEKEKDFESMTNKVALLSDLSASYFSLGKQDEALQWIKEALDINSNDPFANLNLAKIEFEKGYSEEGIQTLKKAKENVETVDQKDPKISRALLLGVLKEVRKMDAVKINDFLAKKEETKNQLNEFIVEPSLLKNDKSLFLTLRKWNSYTPIIPTNKHERSVGGGYFIFHKGKGTIIDPGYNFIDNFFRAGGRIVDIDNIVLTHAHDDHTNDFEPLLSLIYQYNKENDLQIGHADFKRITVYANTGSFKKFCTILDLKEDYIKWVYVLSPSIEFELDDDLVIEAVHAYHEERITNKYAVGLKFVFGKGTNRKTMLFTSDTGLLPKFSKDKTPEIWETYPPDDINVLIVHLGSIRREEFESTPESNWENVLYPDHLGIIGTLQVINMVRPKLAIISEFGEELSDFQKPLVDTIDRAVNKLCNNEKEQEVPKVLPADLPLIYDIFSEQIYCIMTKQMVALSKIEFTLPSPSGDNRFYYRNGEKKDIENIGDKVQEFKDELAERRGLYFKD